MDGKPLFYFIVYFIVYFVVTPPFCSCKHLLIFFKDFKLQLSATEYGTFLSNVQPPISTSIIAEKALDKLVEEFKYLRAQATGDLAKFFDYITYAYMIDNIILLVTGTLHERDTHELLERCHPLGWFETMPALCVATNVAELYNSVLIETPIAPYFKNCLSANDLDELNIEIVRNTLYKAYLEDFYNFSKSIGGATAEIMTNILSFEADRRAINVTVNSFGTDLSREDRRKLYPSIGRLYPEATALLARADDTDAVQQAVSGVSEYKEFFDEMNNAAAGSQKSLEDCFYQHEALLNKLAFTDQFHFAIIWAWVRLREQELRNISWLAECIAMGQKDKINNFVVFV